MIWGACSHFHQSVFPLPICPSPEHSTGAPKLSQQSQALADTLKIHFSSFLLENLMMCLKAHLSAARLDVLVIVIEVSASWLSLQVHHVVCGQGGFLLCFHLNCMHAHIHRPIPMCTATGILLKCFSLSCIIFTPLFPQRFTHTALKSGAHLSVRDVRL